MSVNFGTKRLVVGAHYGLRDWLAQRVTGVLMALFTFVVLAQVLLTKGPLGYDQWAGIFLRPVDENSHFRRHRRHAVPRMGRYARNPDGLRQTHVRAPDTTSFFYRLARGLRGLGHSSPVAPVSPELPDTHD